MSDQPWPTPVTRPDAFERLPGLYRRWEVQRVLVPGSDFHIEEAGTATDGTLVRLLRGRAPDSCRGGWRRAGPVRAHPDVPALPRPVGAGARPAAVTPPGSARSYMRGLRAPSPSWEREVRSALPVIELVSAGRADEADIAQFSGIVARWRELIGD